MRGRCAERRPSVITVVLTSAVLIGACSSADAPDVPNADSGAPSSAAPTTASPPTTDAGPPVELALSGWEVRFGEAFGGQLRQVGRWCWHLVDGGDRALLLFPPGSTFGETAGSVVLPDGERVEHGQTVLVHGVLDHSSMIGPPAELEDDVATYLELCPSQEMIVAADLRAVEEVSAEAATEIVLGFDGSEFAAAWSCGLRRLVAMTDDQMAVVWLYPPQDLSPAGTVIDLPDPDHRIHLAVGPLQLLDFCDDVDGSLDNPRDGHVFEVVGGRLAVTSSVPEVDDCGSASVSFTLHDLVVRTPAGDHALPGPIEFSASDGCLPG